MRRNVIHVLALLTILTVATTPLAAQGIGQNQVPGLWLPNASPGASVGQTIGLTNVEIVYHRPAVNEREIWGGLVPYGQVWRSGANENTLISFSSDVSVEGQPLAAGTYGLHTLPGEGEWEIVFSNDNTAWGSFSYNQENDALRVKVKPESAPHLERLAYGFDDVDGQGAVVALRWEKLRVPFKVEVDPELVLANIRDQLKGLAQFNWPGWNQAAGYCLQNDVNLEEALTWADNSIQAEKRFDNLSTKSQILAKTGQGADAAETMTEALEIANAGQLHNHGRQLQAQGKNEEALEIFKRNATQHADAWFVEVGLARGYSALGNFEEAVKNMKIAKERAPEGQKAYIQGLVDQLEQGKKS